MRARLGSVSQLWRFFYCSYTKWKQWWTSPFSDYCLCTLDVKVVCPLLIFDCFFFRRNLLQFITEAFASLARWHLSWLPDSDSAFPLWCPISASSVRPSFGQKTFPLLRSNFCKEGICRVLLMTWVSYAHSSDKNPARSLKCLFLARFDWCVFKKWDENLEKHARLAVNAPNISFRREKPNEHASQHSSYPENGVCDGNCLRNNKRSMFNGSAPVSKPKTSVLL